MLESGSDNPLIGGDAFIHGLYSEQDLNISGAGAITISVKDTGVNAAGNIIIDGGTINASATGVDGTGIVSKGNSTNINDGQVTAIGSDKAIDRTVKERDRRHRLDRY